MNIPLVFQRLAGNSYIKLPKELDHPRKGLINNIQNTDDDDDNKCFKLCLIRYLSSYSHDPERITKTDKEIEKKLNFKNINSQSKLETFRKLKKRIPLVLMLLAMKINNNILPMYQNNIEKKNMLIIINRRRRKETLCSYQRFYYFHELLYFTTCKKTFLSILLKNF